MQISSRIMGFIIAGLFSPLLGNRLRNALLELLYIPPANAEPCCCSLHLGYGLQRSGAAASCSFTATLRFSRALLLLLLEASPKVGLA